MIQPFTREEEWASEAKAQEEASDLKRQTQEYDDDEDEEWTMTHCESRGEADKLTCK